MIGYVGQTGRAFGAHLHFELYPVGVRYGDVYKAINPQPWLAANGVQHPLTRRAYLGAGAATYVTRGNTTAQRVGSATLFFDLPLHLRYCSARSRSASPADRVRTGRGQYRSLTRRYLLA